MFIKEATQEDYQEVRQRCLQMLEDEHFSGFSKVNFIDYSKHLDNLREEFPQLEFVQKSYGLSVDRRKNNSGII